MRGEFDYLLKWPFQGELTIQILIQEEDEAHDMRTISFKDTVLVDRRRTTQKWMGLLSVHPSH